ncbi:MAG: c-type cytochrome [Caulobacterales bacterium]|nr:c-type cytochrome [Caulobacterales bacterium]
MRLVLAAALALTTALPATAQDGQALYNAQCKSCHTITGVSGAGGPSLKGVFGRKIASAPGFAFSSGLKGKAGTWSDASLEAYLAAPVTFAPGTRMFARVAQPEARKAIIGYLKTLH